MDQEEGVVLTVVSGEPEAEIVCGLLMSNGIECGWRDTDDIESSLEEFLPTGPVEILVHPSDLEAAKAVLPETPAGS